jgi:site-specific DNA recombinase
VQVRAIIGSRLSVYKAPAVGRGSVNKTSPVTQQESTSRYCQMRDWNIVGEFQDLDVSATVAPWDRPELGEWLKDKADGWDAIVWTKVDRAFRDIGDCADVARWAETHKKIIVFTEDGIVLNFRDESDAFATMMAKAFLMIASIFAELELQRIRGRYKAAHSYLRTTNRWATGRPPFGFMIVDHPEGSGKALAVDPVSSQYVRMMAELVLQGHAVSDTADILTARGIPTPSLYQQTVKGGSYKRQPNPVWSFSTVYQILRNPACLGYKMTVPDVKNRGRKTGLVMARGNDGMPIVMCDPIFTDEEWALIQAKLDERGASPERTRNAGDLLGVVLCGNCGHRLHRNCTTVKGTTYIYYYCPKRPGKAACKGYSFREDRLVAIIDDQAPQKLAERHRMRRVFKPGEDHTRELERNKKAMRDIRSERDNEGYDYPGGEEEYQERLANLIAKRKMLEALPQRPDEWIEEPTGRTYADDYNEADRAGKRLILIEAGFFLSCSPEIIRVHEPENLDGLMPSLQVV